MQVIGKLQVICEVYCITSEALSSAAVGLPCLCSDDVLDRSAATRRCHTAIPGQSEPSPRAVVITELLTGGL